MLEVKKSFEKGEIYSEELNDILTKIPNWLIHSGSGWILAIIFMLLALASFIKYPEIIKAPVLITSSPSVIKIMSENSGYLNLWVSNHEHAQKGQYLGYLKTESDVNDVLELLREIDSLKSRTNIYSVFTSEYKLQENFQLGKLQELYSNFILRLKEFQILYSQDKYKKQIGSLRKLLNYQTLLLNEKQNQKSNFEKELKLARQKFERDSILFSQKVISKLNFEESNIELLQIKRDLFNLNADGLTANIKLLEVESQIDQLERDRIVSNQNYFLAAEAAMNNLYQNLKSWELEYMIKSPISGDVVLSQFWTNFQYVNVKEEILSIVPEKIFYFVQVKAPINRSGKLKIGQPVNIKLDAYPFEQYGIVKGVIKSLSPIPREGVYFLEVDLTNGLITSSNHNIEFKPELTGTAEVITHDLSLLSRFFYQFRILTEQ